MGRNGCGFNLQSSGLAFRMHKMQYIQQCMCNILWEWEVDQQLLQDRGWTVGSFQVSQAYWKYDILQNSTVSVRSAAHSDKPRNQISYRAVYWCSRRGNSWNETSPRVYRWERRKSFCASHTIGVIVWHRRVSHGVERGFIRRLAGDTPYKRQCGG